MGPSINQNKNLRSGENRAEASLPPAGKLHTCKFKIFARGWGAGLPSLLDEFDAAIVGSAVGSVVGADGFGGAETVGG
jgi:hypothetical protein